MSYLHNAGGIIRHLVHPPDPVVVSDLPKSHSLLLAGTAPLITPLVFENTASDARDHCANERNFMSFLRLSIYLYIVGLALLFSFSFSLVDPPTEMEKRLSLPMGIVFICLSLGCLAMGGGQYLGTVRKYGKRKAIVESGRVARSGLVLVAGAICASCIVLVVTGAESQGANAGGDPMESP
ncbi:hypothetical protein EX30DRAFT_343747 [Ascodesmis nigricans]|uniref:DUF202 domain-containing protein n=1 Tax=Ascodesmis nigricans TaxID=341454 RepID=A0A4S2MRR9_9PEZI|nr:hypothetical protein EX30DRAFT_343747 [Ascodesmis nigricans]